MNKNLRIEPITKVHSLIQGDGWLLNKETYRPVTLACGHIKLVNPKRRVWDGQNRECTICTHENFEAGTYNMTEAVIRHNDKKNRKNMYWYEELKRLQDSGQSDEQNENFKAFVNAQIEENDDNSLVYDPSDYEWEPETEIN